MRFNGPPPALTIEERAAAAVAGASPARGLPRDPAGERHALQALYDVVLQEVEAQRRVLERPGATRRAQEEMRRRVEDLAKVDAMLNAHVDAARAAAGLPPLAPHDHTGGN